MKGRVAIVTGAAGGFGRVLVRGMLERGSSGAALDVTETGLATWDLPTRQPGRYDLQTLMLERAVTAPVERLYWYCAIDLDPHRAAIEGFHVDENEYHMGLVTYAGEKKPAYFRFQELLSGSTSAA